jgi:FAD/FMN-containing dehydrogenase
MSTVSAKVTDLTANFSGPVLVPGDASYDTVRKVHNGMVDKRPAIIARCRGVADIAAAVRFARSSNIPVAIRGGGHNVSGRATIEGGMMIDLSLMKGVQVDPRAGTARAQGGVTWGEFNRDTQAYSLACTGGVVSTTGIAGLTLGGGLGWLLGTHGLSIDNLRSVELVTAQGEIVFASPDDNQDLFWGLRGGGGNFGVAASFEYGLHPVGPMVYGGPVLHPFAVAEDVLRFYRDFTANLPVEVTLVCGFLHAPDGSGNKLVGMVAGYNGSQSEGERVLAPVKRFGTPVVDAIGPMPYCQLNTLFDASLAPGLRNYWKSSFFADLSDEAIRAAVDAFASVSSPISQLILEHIHGATSRVAVDATAFPHRRDGYNFVFVSQWTDPAEDNRHMTWTRGAYASLQPFTAAARYMNYMDHDDVGDAAAAAYGSNYALLQAIKAKYDPDNFFNQNLNIRPAQPVTQRRSDQAASGAHDGAAV